MNRTRPYLNRFVKIKEQEIEDIYHTANLKEIKPITSKLMEHSETIVINHGKREMIKEVREVEIQRQNRLLLQKISSVMTKKGNYSVVKTKSYHAKPNKSLNQIYRKKQLQNIELENKRFLQRLQGKKPTVNLQKINRDWIDNKGVIKRLSNQQFYLSNLRSNSSRIKQNSFSQKIIKNKIKLGKLNRMATIDGHKMMIRIEFIDDFLKIVGDSQDHKDLKVIEIPKEEAIIFIQKDCNGKLQLLLEKLKYDAESQTLYLISDNIQDDSNYFKEFNPEIDQTKKHNNNKPVNSLRMNKSAIEESQNPKIIEKQKELPIQTISHPIESVKKYIECEEQHKLEHCKHCPPKELGKIQNSQAKQKTQSKKQLDKQIAKKTVQHVQKEENVQPQQEKYEEEYFEEPAKQISAKEQIQEIADSTLLPSNSKPNAEKIQRSIIVEPEDNNNYVQEFQESKQPKLQIAHSQEIHDKQII